MNSMDKKSRLLLAVLLMGTLVSLGLTYYHTVIQGNFVILESEEEEVVEEETEEVEQEEASPEGEEDFGAESEVNTTDSGTETTE